MNLSSETAKQSETLAQLRCVAGWADGIHKPIITLSIINIFLSITAFLGNFLILVALHKESSLHSPSKFLYRCLATTDLCVGLISEPSAVMYWLSLINEYWNFCLFMQITHFVAGFILASVSLLTMTAVSVDRLLALILGLRYKQVVTLKRTYLLLIIFWIVSSILGATSSFVNHRIAIRFSYVVIGVCLITTTVSYMKIFHGLHHNQNQLQSACATSSPQHGAIQRGSAQCTVGAVGISSLLFTVRHSHSCSSWRESFSLWISSLWMRRDLSLLKLFVEPVSLLLEDYWSETSSKGDNQTSTLLSADLVVAFQ